MIMRIAIICFLCLFISSKQTNDVIYIKESTFEGYIFDKNYYALISIKKQKERYTPTKEDIIKAESVIERNLSRANKFLENQGENCPIIHKNLRNYTRQYLGFINNHGDKIIWINFIWKSKTIEDNLSSDILFMMDGCSYYWNIKVNLNSKKLFDLHINGKG